MKSVKQLHTGNVLLSPVHVQLTPQNLGQPLHHSENTVNKISHRSDGFFFSDSGSYLIEISALLDSLQHRREDGGHSDHLHPSTQRVGVTGLITSVLVFNDQSQRLGMVD